jgi:hypothetical protein
MQIQARSILLAAILLVLLKPSLTFAWGTFIVDPNCSWAYHTIQAAVDAATAYTDDSHADYIWISDDVAYTGQHIIINDPETEIIEGGFTDCNDYDPGTDHTTISGAGNDGGPVFQITGNGAAVVFSNLYITGANRPGQNGGGIYFSGHGLLQIELTSIYLNEAGYGGGIYFSGSGGDATLYLEHDTTVLNNTADVSGGGIRIEGTSRLFALKPQTWIGFNHAMNGYGGGLEILGPARADIGSSYNGSSVVSWNDARRTDSSATGAGNGGGIAVIDNGNGEGVVRTFADASATPTAISSNTADYHGGGLYLYGAASACLFASSLVDDIAEDGAAIYEDNNAATDVGLYVNGGAPTQLGTECGPETVASLGGVKDCSSGDAACSTISNNTTQHSDGTASAGTIVVTYGAFVGARLRMRDNLAHQLIQHSDLNLTRCLLTDNNVSGTLLHSFYGLARVHSCTIANNVIGDSFVMQYPDGYSSVDLAYDIIDQSGNYAVNWVSGHGTFDVSYVMDDNTAGLPQNNPSVVNAIPFFVDATNGDYHLRPMLQVAIDFGQGSNFDGGPDLDGMPAPVDLAAIPNRFSGAADLGAYERQSMFNCGTADTLFCNGFEN